MVMSVSKWVMLVPCNRFIYSDGFHSDRTKIVKKSGRMIMEFRIATEGSTVPGGRFSHFSVRSWCGFMVLPLVYVVCSAFKP